VKTAFGWLGGILVFGWICYILFAPPFAGLADNSDYERVLQPAGFVPNEHPRYAHAYRDFTLTPAAGDVWGILFPRTENVLGYVSSLTIPIKAAMLLNFAAKQAAGGDPLSFDIRWLGLVYAVMMAAGIALFACGIKLRTAHARVLAFLLAAFMLCDAGYLLYFHSFYGEALTMAAGMLAVGAAARLLRADPKRKAPLLLYYGACLLFVSAKVANAPLGVPAALFGAALLFFRRDAFSRAAVAVGGAALLLVSYCVYASAPPWMKAVNHYHTIFYGVLKDSPSPEADMRELGIPDKYAGLAGTHGYMPDAPYNIYGEEFRKEVYDNAPLWEVAMFYARHPDRLLDKLRLSAESALPLRPAYLGNTLPGEGDEGRYSFAKKPSFWEPLRKRAVGYALPIAAAVFVLWTAALAVSAVRLARRPDPRAAAGLAGGALLAASCAAQFAIPVVGNGEADLQKHMFLFNFLFDLMLLAALCKLADRVRLRTAAAAALLAALAAACAAPGAAERPAQDVLREGDTVRFGAYDGKPILWTVLAREEEGILLWARESVAAMPFDRSDERNAGGDDRGSNEWAASDLRAWLNGPFLAGFGADERRLIAASERRTLLSYAGRAAATEGDQPYFWNSHPLYVKQNADRAYAVRETELVFILDIVELQDYAAAKGRTLRKPGGGAAAAPYWVRTPYASGVSEVRVVGADGFVYHRDAATAAIGVVPALLIRADAEVAGGSGTERDPYVLAP